QVMERPKDSMSEVKFFDVPNTNALGHVFNLKPCVETSWNTVLKSHVYMIRSVPSVTGDHRALEATEEFAILAGQHAVGNIGELGYPHHLRISLGVLGGVQNEIKCLDSTNSPSDCDSFASYHRCLQNALPGTNTRRGYFLDSLRHLDAVTRRPIRRLARPSSVRAQPVRGGIWAARAESEQPCIGRCRRPTGSPRSARISRLHAAHH